MELDYIDMLLIRQDIMYIQTILIIVIKYGAVLIGDKNRRDFKAVWASSVYSSLMINQNEGTDAALQNSFAILHQQLVTSCKVTVKFQLSFVEKKSALDFMYLLKWKGTLQGLPRTDITPNMSSACLPSVEKLQSQVSLIREGKKCRGKGKQSNKTKQ